MAAGRCASFPSLRHVVVAVVGCAAILQALQALLPLRLLLARLPGQLVCHPTALPSAKPRSHPSMCTGAPRLHRPLSGQAQLYSHAGVAAGTLPLPADTGGARQLVLALHTLLPKWDCWYAGSTSCCLCSETAGASRGQWSAIPAELPCYSSLLSQCQHALAHPQSTCQLASACPLARAHADDCPRRRGGLRDRGDGPASLLWPARHANPPRLHDLCHRCLSEAQQG